VNFVPLHIYSGYSFLRSGLSVEKIIKLSIKNHYFGVAISDYETMSGLAELCHTVKGTSLIPAYGLDVEVEGNLLSLYIDNEDGYRNLMAINLAASEKRLNHEFVLTHSKGLTAVLAVDHSKIHSLYKDHPEEVPQWLVSFQTGMEKFYLGLPYLPAEQGLVDFIREFVVKYPYDTVAFPHFLYEKDSDAIVLDITQAIAKEETLQKKEAIGSCHFLDEATLSSYYQEAELFNSRVIAERSKFVFVQKRGGLLVYPNSEGLTSADYLTKLSYAGLSKRMPGFGEEYKKRLDYELGVIISMGYADYFLIVQDYVNYAKTHGISVGPGRGSGAGSLVSYSLNIVAADPLKYDLLFERFLNPERQSMPDIDVDFADVKRDLIVDYLISKYGKERVSRIVTMQTLGARQSLRDIGRVFQYENREIDMIAKLIVDPKWTLRDAYRNNPKFKELIDSDRYYLEIVSLASKIEGLPRQAGLHAAGVVLNDKPLESAIPISNEENVGYVAQYEMNYLEEQGFLKMDLLGLRNLTIVDECLALVKANTGEAIDYQKIPWEDEKSIELIRSGRTMGLFQLESAGMKRAIQDIQPNSFSDVVALLALFRPGPMDNIESFSARKHGVEKVTYLAPEVEKILAPTYGIIVYQEQIMQIVRALAGFSFGQADLFRRAISKKDAAKLGLLQEDFVKGCLKMGHDIGLANKTYALIYKFADYGFPKSHALGYAVLTCQMAYLKSHFPNEFYASILDNCGGTGDSKFTEIISEIKKQRIKLSLPDINEAGEHFIVKDGRLIFPLTSIKGLQTNFIIDALDERTIHGPYKSLFDFAARMKRFGLNLPTLVKMVDAGAFDSIHKGRAALRSSCPSAMNYAEMLYGENGEQIHLLGIVEPALPDVADNTLENLNAEHEALGLMISGSPLALHENALKGRNLTTLADLPESHGSVEVAGIIKSLRVITTKKGQPMAFMSLYDDTSEADFIIFSDEYTKSYQALKQDNAVVVMCRKDPRKGDSFLADLVTTLD